MNLEPYLIDFDSLNVGDEVFHIRVGRIIITNISIASQYPIRLSNGGMYCRDGKSSTQDLYPIIFKSNPFEAPEPVSEYPKLMRVWNVEPPLERIVIGKYHDQFISYQYYTSLERLPAAYRQLFLWDNAEDIPEPITVPKTVLSRADIARLAGCPLEELEILED